MNYRDVWHEKIWNILLYIIYMPINFSVALIIEKKSIFGYLFFLSCYPSNYLSIYVCLLQIWISSQLFSSSLNIISLYLEFVCVCVYVWVCVCACVCVTDCVIYYKVYWYRVKGSLKLQKWKYMFVLKNKYLNSIVKDVRV